MTKEMKEGLPVLSFSSEGNWEEWLGTNHASSSGLWLKIARKNSGFKSVTYSEALDVAICFGWIDGQKGSYDKHYWLQRFTRRRSRSRWSKRNRERAILLIEQGKIRPAGLHEIELAKQNGSWEAAYDSPATATVPPDLKLKLEENPKAQKFFAELDSRNRYAILYQIQDAKRPETRARRIEKYVEMLNEDKTLY